MNEVKGDDIDRFALITYYLTTHVPYYANPNPTAPPRLSLFLTASSPLTYFCGTLSMSALLAFIYNTIIIHPCSATTKAQTQ